MRTCRFCAEEIQDAANVCKHCGRTVGVISSWNADGTPRFTASGGTGTEGATLEGAAKGAGGGILVVLMLFGFGIVLLPFGIGIPLLFLAMILALILPLAGGMVGSGLGKIAGPCPHCGHRVTAAARAPGVTCPACARRLVVRDKQFIAV